jgi:hypothetical protein
MPADERPALPTPQQAIDQPEIFISYAHEDKPRADWIGKVLSDRGWFVWKDSRIGGGQLWKNEIARALGAARCVVVLWSKASTQSNWVLDEAGDGFRRGILVPALLDDVEIPLGFRQVQAINLAHSTGDEDRDLDGLVAAVGRVLGQPVVEPPKPPWALALLKRWGSFAGIVLPLVVVLLLQTVRARQTTIDLEVHASEVSFGSTEQQDVSDLMLVSDLDVAGLVSLQVPRARDRVEQTLTAPNGRSLAIKIRTGSAVPSAGTITLTPVSVARGAHVTFGAGTDPLRYRISFSRSPLPVQVNLQGALDVVLAGHPTERIDFGTPKPMFLEPDPNGVEIGIRSKERPQSLLASPLSIDRLSFIRIDERVQTGQTVVTMVPTIISGTWRLEALAGREQKLGPGEGLRFGESQGELQALQLTDTGLLVRFRGQVRQMEMCSRIECESRMPTDLESLTARHARTMVALVVGYVLYLLAVGRRWLKLR